METTSELWYTDDAGNHGRRGEAYKTGFGGGNQYENGVSGYNL